MSGPPVPPVRIDPLLTHDVAQVRNPSPLIGCRYSPCGQFVFVSAQDNSVVRYSADLKTRLPLTGHKSWVRALAFSADLLLSADWAGRLIAWPYAAAKPEPRFHIAAHRGWARALAVSPDGKLLASCGNDKLVKLWSLPDGKPVSSFPGHDSHVYNVAFHPSGKALASCDLMGHVKHWSLPDGKPLRSLDATVLHKYDKGFGADIGGARGMAFDASGKLLACAGITDVTNAFAGVGQPLIVLFDWETGKHKQLLRPKAKFQATMWGAAFLPTGHVVGVAGGSGGMFYAWKPDQSASLVTFRLKGNARDLAVHPNNRRAAVPLDSGILQLLDMGPKG